jgi:release factor glutamine methyltransferase
MDNQPIEYKKGYTNFANCKIDLSIKPMIPRKETEFWVKKVIQKLSRKTGSRFAGKIDVLDIFAGSGCIGIAILKGLSRVCRVDFLEIDKNFIKQIKINLKLNKINPRKYRVIQSDIFKNIKGGFDYIFANPPYIPLKNKHLVQRSVYNFEPHLALFGGEDGLLYIRKFLRNARKFLKKNGKIYMEFDYSQKMELENLLKKLNYKNFRFCKDQFKKWRYVCIKN